jgi:hypothetical protein
VIADVFVAGAAAAAAVVTSIYAPPLMQTRFLSRRRIFAARCSISLYIG